MQHASRKSPRAAASAPQRSTEQLFVLMLTAAFVGAMLMLGALQTRGMFARSKSRQMMGMNLEQVSAHQDSYRVVHGRFATWAELEARGERVSEGLKVVRSSATVSHWYVQLLDPASGLVCDRIHELAHEYNEMPEQNTCRESTLQ